MCLHLLHILLVPKLSGYQKSIAFPHHTLPKGYCVSPVVSTYTKLPHAFLILLDSTSPQLLKCCIALSSRDLSLPVNYAKDWYKFVCGNGTTLTFIASGSTMVTYITLYRLLRGTSPCSRPSMVSAKTMSPYH